MILFDDGFFAEFDDCFMCYLGGRLKSGKSLTAVELAERKLKKGYKLISQVQCVWNDDPETVVMDHLGRRKCVIWIDEVGLYFRTSKSANAVSSFASKQNCYLIFSGRKPPHEDLCDLTIRLRFDWWKNFLIPMQTWRWDRINGKDSYHGFLHKTAWWDFYGIYNTLDPADNPEIMVQTVKKWTQEYFVKYDRSYKLHDVETSGGEDFNEFSNELAQSSRRMGEAAKEIASVSRFQARRR